MPGGLNDAALSPQRAFVSVVSRTVQSWAAQTLSVAASRSSVTT